MVAQTNKNNMKNKKMKSIIEDASATPNNPAIENIETVLPHKDGAMSHGVTLAMASGMWTEKEEGLGTNQEIGKEKDLRSDMSSPWWTGTPEMGGAMPPLNKCLKLKEEELCHTSVEEVLIMKSTPLSIAWREEKKKTVQEEGLTVAIVMPMLQRLSKEEPQLCISNEDWETCIEFLIGQGNPGQINSRQTSRLGRLLSEALDELSPPQAYRV